MVRHQKTDYIVKQIDCGIIRYISELQLNNQTPGLSILIKKNNETVYEKSIGKSVVSSNSPESFLSFNSRFLCASLTKPVVCKFFIDLNRKNPGIIQKTLDNFFPQYKNSYMKKITIQLLLTHRAGLAEYFGSFSGIPYHQLDSFNLKRISTHILDQKPVFNPGKKIEYSNSSFVILSRIVELIFKNEYEPELKKYFKSLGDFKNTFFFTDSNKPGTAQYIKINKRYIKAPWSRAFTGWGDGALISSPAEYLELINPLEDKKILNYLFKLRSHKFNLCYRHAGSSVGMSNLYFFIPQINLRGVCFQNFTNSFDEMTFSQDINNFFSDNRTNYI